MSSPEIWLQVKIEFSIFYPLLAIVILSVLSSLFLIKYIIKKGTQNIKYEISILFLINDISYP